MKTGCLDRRRVELAAALGDTNARATGVAEPVLPEEFEARIKTGISALSQRQAVSFGLECANRVLAVWEALRGYDKRPEEALATTRLWLLGRTPADRVAIAGKAAADAAIDADDPDQIPLPRMVIAAINSADSVSHAALAAEYTAKLDLGQDPGVGGVEDCVCYAATFARAAAADSDAERKWQVTRLIDCLLQRQGGDG
jgi:hypothetical protein